MNDSKSVEEVFGSQFKPEIKSSGRKLLAEEKISLSTKSDTAIQAYVRVSPPYKVTFSAEEITSPFFTIHCTCPASKKNRFCKHVWATLLRVEQEHPDFLCNKTELERVDASLEPIANKQTAYQETAKAKASLYRKDQYQKQKARVKERKLEARGKGKASTLRGYSEEVESALRYFSENGFPMEEGPSLEIMNEAKRKLSRFFHPDRGGTHSESVELNQHCETIAALFNS